MSHHFHSQCLPVTHAGELFLLHPQKVMYWPAQKILFAADIHVGKEQVFGRHGIAIPGGISEATLNRLFDLAYASGAARLIILGDFMHNVPLRSEQWLSCLSQLLDKHKHLSVEIVAGNHDRKAGRAVVDSRVTWIDESLSVAGLLLRHDPQDNSQAYVLSGHMHPVWRVGHARRGAIRAPVFWFRKGHMVMPSFGEFTGGHLITPIASEDSLYITGPDCVLEVPAKASSRYKR